MRLKAKALNYTDEDYDRGIIYDVCGLYTGRTVLTDVPSQVISELYEVGFCKLEQVMKKKPAKNSFFILKSDRNSVLACYNPIENRLEKVDKRPVYGVRPRNAEQTFAIHAILNPDIKLISIQEWPVPVKRCLP